MALPKSFTLESFLQGTSYKAAFYRIPVGKGSLKEPAGSMSEIVSEALLSPPLLFTPALEDETEPWECTPPASVREDFLP